MTTCDRDLVGALGLAIAQRIGEPRYQLWFQPNTKFHCDDDGLVIGVPNHFFQEWLHTTFGDAVRDAAALVFARPLPVRFAIDPELFQAARRAQHVPAAAVRSEVAREGPDEPIVTVALDASSKSDRAARAGRRPRHWRRLADFVVGACNRVAHAAAVNTVESPGDGPSPLIFHGPVGTGKTHLLEGVYSGLRKSRGDWRTILVTAEEFTNRFVQAMRFNKLSAFRHHFRGADALLMDDMQFLASKPATQEEFLHTLDALAAAGGVLVATSDCHPRLTDDFTPELADRLVGGAAWALTSPDTETRFGILKNKAARAECLAPDSVLRLLAEKLHGNVRQLEGALHSLQHLALVAQRPIDTGLAQETIGSLLRDVIRTYRMEDVDAAVCRALGLDAAALRSKQRAWAVSHPRMLAMHLARKHTSATYGEIGHYFGDRNHSTAVAAEKKVRSWLREDEELVLGERRLHIRGVLEAAERELLR